MKKIKGVTLIEMLIAISILAVLLGWAYFRFYSVERAAENQSAARLVQQAITEVREKARNPKGSSDDPSVDLNINGYGVHFTDIKNFFVYADAKDPSRPKCEHQYMLKDPDQPTQDCAADTIITRYSLNDIGAKNISISHYRGGTSGPWLDFLTGDLFITYSEEAAGSAPYLNGIENEAVIQIRLLDTDGNEIIVQYCSCGKIHNVEIL